MFVEDPNDLDDIERMIKFQQLAEEYGRSIAAWETAPWVSELELLQRDGIDLPAPDDLDDDALTAALWAVIENMATRNTFFHQTDHLSERQFYERLYHEIVHEGTKDYAAVLDAEEMTALGAVVHSIDMCESDGDPTDYWRYYADDETREAEAELFCEVEMPEREACPYDRDRFLPRSLDERMMERGEIEPFELTDLPEDGMFDGDDDFDDIPY